MTYVNGNVMAGPTPSAPLDKWAHDDCLPADQLETFMLDDFSTRRTDPVTGFAVYDKVPHVHQNWPWHWHPVYGGAHPCYVCGKPVR
jgi:hypothetical protein